MNIVDIYVGFKEIKDYYNVYYYYNEREEKWCINAYYVKLGMPPEKLQKILTAGIDKDRFIYASRLLGEISFRDETSCVKAFNNLIKYLFKRDY